MQKDFYKFAVAEVCLVKEWRGSVCAVWRGIVCVYFQQRLQAYSIIEKFPEINLISYYLKFSRKMNEHISCNLISREKYRKTRGPQFN